jgi:hypothetical protein
MLIYARFSQSRIEPVPFPHGENSVVEVNLPLFVRELENSVLGMAGAEVHALAVIATAGLSLFPHSFPLRRTVADRPGIRRQCEEVHGRDGLR